MAFYPRVGLEQREAAPCGAEERGRGKPYKQDARTELDSVAPNEPLSTLHIPEPSALPDGLTQDRLDSYACRRVCTWGPTN